MEYPKRLPERWAQTCRCSKCGELTDVIETRDSFRRRRCKLCGYRYGTVEVPEEDVLLLYTAMARLTDSAQLLEQVQHIISKFKEGTNGGT